MSQHRYLDPTNDVAFKKVFGDKERLKDFLNAILRRPEGFKIIELDFVPQEEIPDLGQGKRSIFDLKCKDESGKVYVVEMQNRREPHFLKRVQCYASHTYISQLSVGEWHSDLMPVIVVAISKTNLFPKEVKCISYHRTREDETNQQHLFELTYVFIELGKFAKKEEELNSIEDYWLYFLAKSQIAKKPPKAITDEMVLQAYKTIEQFNWSESEYDAYLRARLLAEAEELTLEKSYTDGKQEGIQLGKQKGKAERNIEIVENMLYQGIDIEIIAKSTGLTLEQIIALRDGNKPV
jgi:predicted transposase/invertase (TIGR01784 family)